MNLLSVLLPNWIFFKFHSFIKWNLKITNLKKIQSYIQVKGFPFKLNFTPSLFSTATVLKHLCEQFYYVCIGP